MVALRLAGEGSSCVAANDETLGRMRFDLHRKAGESPAGSCSDLSKLVQMFPVDSHCSSLTVDLGAAECEGEPHSFSSSLESPPDSMY